MILCMWLLGSNAGRHLGLGSLGGLRSVSRHHLFSEAVHSWKPPKKGANQRNEGRLFGINLNEISAWLTFDSHTGEYLGTNVLAWKHAAWWNDDISMTSEFPKSDIMLHDSVKDRKCSTELWSYGGEVNWQGASEINNSSQLYWWLFWKVVVHCIMMNKKSLIIVELHKQMKIMFETDQQFLHSFWWIINCVRRWAVWLLRT